MGKKSKLIILLFVTQALLVVPLFAGAITQNDYSSFVPEKIYERIDTITFTWDSSVLNYGVTMASKFEKKNDTYTRLRLDVFVESDNNNYVTSLFVNLTYNVTFTVNDQDYHRTGVVNDTSSFYQTATLIYTFEVCSVDISGVDLFPATVGISINYNFTSAINVRGRINKIGAATASNTFLGPTIMQIIVYGIIAAVVLTIVFGVRSSRRRRAARYKAVAARTGMQAGIQAPPAAPQAMPPTSGTSVQVGVPASLIGMASPPGTPPPAESSPMICPACGGNVVNSKCQSCGSLICRGCGHINAAGGHFCEKCGKNL